MFQDGPLLSYFRDKRPDILKTFKEQHETVLEVLQEFREFRSHVNTMVNNMDV